MQKDKDNKEFAYFVIIISFIVLLNVDLPQNNYQTCFTPPHNQCGSFIVNHINQANKSIYVQAYGFTHPDIIHSLIEAKKRNVNVEIILDSSNFSKKKLLLIKELEEAGIKIYKAKVSGIAHNKIMIIDKNKVLTGSFNFTKSADTRNAENVLVIKDRQLVKKYLDNWFLYNL
jgi:phospholipase D